VSSDLSPQPGSGLDAPSRPEGTDAAGSPRRPASAEPSLAHVIATTLRLWLRRRVLHVADGARIGALRWTAVAAVVLIVAGAAGGGAAAALARSQPARPAARHHAPPPISPAQAATTANEQAAAGWIASQVARSTTVACDPAMCPHLQAAGFPETQQLMLQPGSTLPVAAAGTTALVVATAEAHAYLGAQLTDAAPEVLASFGAGQEGVQVRVIGSNPAAFRSAARAALAGAVKRGKSLSRNRRVHLAGQARRQLLSGLIDPRLLVVLDRLVAAHPVELIGFGSAAPGTAWPAQLRSVTITGLVHGSGRHRTSDVAAVLRLLHRQPVAYRPTVQQGKGTDGAVTLTIEFPAPSPL
jgi:hypothetical protein